MRRRCIRMNGCTVFAEELRRYYEVWQETNSVYEEWAKAHGISLNCLLMLVSIDEGGEGCTQKKISSQWMIPKQTVNMLLKDLENKHFVELFPLPQDKRTKQIRFTPEGKAYADAVLSELRKAELFVIEKMGLERIRILNENMALFASLFSEAGGDDA